MFGSILHRMILWELVKVFVMALIGITGHPAHGGHNGRGDPRRLGADADTRRHSVAHSKHASLHHPGHHAVRMLRTYGRISADNEILAIKASGVNILLVVRPGLLLGLAMTGLTMVLYFNVHSFVASVAETDGFRRCGGNLLFHAAKQRSDQLCANALCHVGGRSRGP